MAVIAVMCAGSRAAEPSACLRPWRNPGSPHGQGDTGKGRFRVSSRRRGQKKAHRTSGCGLAGLAFLLGAAAPACVGVPLDSPSEVSSVAGAEPPDGSTGTRSAPTSDLAPDLDPGAPVDLALNPVPDAAADFPGDFASAPIPDVSAATPPDVASGVEVGANGFASVRAGAGYACGLRRDSSLVCWGRNDLGQATPPVGPSHPSAPESGARVG
jgi:hypothetical protein